MLQQPFFQVTLPLMITFIAAIWVAQWSQNKRFDDLKETIKDGLEAIERRLDKIEEDLRKMKEELSELKLARWK